MDKWRIIQTISYVLFIVNVIHYCDGNGRLEGYVRHGKGLYPDLLNLAATATITSNATCGEVQQEIYCKPNEHRRDREPQCSVCDGRSPDKNRRHSAQNAIDGTNSWWQSPSLANGWEYHWVTLTLDLQQIYQVDYIIVKSAISPRPGNWILERSIDGIDFQPWQFYAASNSECMTAYDMSVSAGRPEFRADDEVICVSQYSKLNPIEGGEIHTSLVNGRPGSSAPSDTLLRFTEARYIRLRLQKILVLPGDHQATGLPDRSDARKYFYSIKDISIGGRCSCNGHADRCNLVDGHQKCICSHNTCGDQCNQCCPMFNQHKWQAGNATDGSNCEPCNCNRHATACRYDPEMDSAKLSLNSRGEHRGGGVCIRCLHSTAGNNCEKCKKGYYRPEGIRPEAPKPCVPCDCEGPGVTPYCVGDDTQASLGLPAGSCICKEGFAGHLCTDCAQGYRNFPRCQACPCSRAGSKNKVCEGHCICKDNVIGQGCDTCKPGTFHLDEYNPVGCTECFCNGVTDKCAAAKLPVYIISEKENWKVADLGRTRVVEAKRSGSSMSIDHEQMLAFNAYYWVAPSSYLGARMTSYGQKIRIKTSWVILRGDTSGKATKCPEIIIEGAGYRIAYGGKYHKNANELLLDVPLYEQDWYHFPKDILDIGNDEDVSSYSKGQVTRREMMEILRSMESLMIRARFNTVQAEARLHDVLLEYGKEGEDSSTATLVTGAVERCICPEGYTGLSCDTCLPGYRRINNVVFGGQCIPCNCNGHVDFCDAATGKCGECKHNTVGRNCNRCSEGYYGDATIGKPDDCKQCSCPLPIGQNHFTPECQDTGVKGRESFKCVCPVGYEGNRCQDCFDGYFGNPMIPGNYCQPCDCNGNVHPEQRGYCDKRTGQCINCLGNTDGWNCENCKENHYGDPKRGQCLKCDCYTTGSTSMTCDERTGQCPCKPLYGGRRCETCASGRGGILDGCPLCECSRSGSKSTFCDPITGQCPCKQGVTGRRCKSCLADHYGDLRNGCLRCNCDSSGSFSSTCDIVSGQCPCKSNVVGRTCNSCKLGFWGLSAGLECQKCKCSLVGTLGGQCNDLTGQCECKPGVGGTECSRCLPGYWGYSPHGCKQCEPCDHPGKNCDPNSGRCVCPSNTEGDRCERCSQGYWDYSADIGCRSCSCSGPGSLERQCDPRNGRCICRQGFEGSLCDKCSFGFYGYSDCRPCSCNRAGSDLRRCKDGQCQCDENGQCPCKQNVRGNNCDRCAEGTFGLAATNPLGCYSCFCFKKSSHCSQADLTWSQLALPGERKVEVADGDTKVNITNQLYVIPDFYGDVKIGTSFSFLAPLYWQLPLELLRDKTMSYNGFLRFRVQSRQRQQQTFPEQILQSYPLVSLQGNWKLILEHYPDRVFPDGRYEVRLHESSWKKQSSNAKVTREEMMIALQNLQHILIRATSSDDFTTATLSEVTLDIAAEGTPVSSRKAVGVERCNCPENYSGFSCQNPNFGFYRWFKENHIQSTIIIDLVGESKPCRCNNRADECDQETGICLGCRENTAGPHCDYCASGYYGEPNRGRSCKPCACPSRKQNFAETCEADPYSEYVCHCKQGYTGNKCERCDDGYYGNPNDIGGSCRPCKCDPNGSKGIGCDSAGICRCRPGITGRDCSQCLERHVVSENGCISCADGCVDVLLDDIQGMINEVTSFDVNNILTAPWPGLHQIMNETEILRNMLNRYESREDASQAMLLDFDLDYTARVLKERAERVKEGAKDNLPESEDIKQEAQSNLNLILGLRSLLEDAISALENYALGETPSITVVAALDEAELLLREIKARSFKRFDEKSRFELKRAKQLLEEIRRMLRDNTRIDDLVIRIQDMDNKIEDLTDRIRSSNVFKDMAIKLNEVVVRKIARMRSTLHVILNANVYTEDRNFNSTRLIRRARRKLDNTHQNFEILEELMIDLRNKSALLAEFEATLWHLNSEYKKKYVQPAENHALHLKAQAIKLEKLFHKIRDVADGPLRAAEAYQRIVDAILSAEVAARNALEAASNAYQAAYPENPDNSLVRRSKLLIERSRGLREKGKSLRINVMTLAKNLEEQWIGLQTTKQIIDDSSKKLRIMEEIIRKLSASGISREIVSALSDIEIIVQQSDRTLRHVETIKTNLTIIKEYTTKIKSQDTSLLKGIEDDIKFIKGATMKGQRLSGNLRNQANRIEVIGSNLKDRIEALKRKIQQTRQHATSIKVSLTTDQNGICTRKYRPNMQPSTTSRLTLGYAINTRQRDAMLLFMGAANHSDFMAVEMINRRIHFTWDAGKGSKTIIHPLLLETNNFHVSDENKWYHIAINRIGNIGELQVRPAVTKHSSRNKQYLEPVSDASPAGYTRMDLQTSDSVYVGGVPDEFSSSVRARNFAGCLHYVTLDGEPLGLWNFTESIGCGACNEGFDLDLKVEDKTANSFNGKGYFKGYNVLRRPRPFYSVVLSFRSLDEDALLFLAVNDMKNQYFSLELSDGRVKFTVQFDEQTRLVLKSEKKLNNMNDLIQIQAIVENSARGGKRGGRLVVSDQDQMATIRGGPDLDLAYEPFYFGGVDPQFSRERWGRQIELRSILGCMGALSVLEVGKNPHTDGQFYGIDPSCQNEPISNVGFLGMGFLEMPSQVLKRVSSFGFTFKTMAANSLLMISTFKGQPLRGALVHPPDYYSVSIAEGRLDLRLFAGTTRHRLLSRLRYNDGKLHSFFVTKENRKVQLFVDDEIVNSTRLDRGKQIVKAPGEGGLYFGGVPPEVIVDRMVGSSIPFKGCIQDVIVNDELLSFNEPIRFDNSFIGRCADLPKHAMGGMTSDEKQIMSCMPPKQHTVEYGALKFGDQPESHVVLPVKKNIFKHHYTLSFEFRTYYPSGLFFLAYNQRTFGLNNKLDMIAAHLLNSRLVIDVYRKNKRKRIISPLTALNSGQWRKIVIEKIHRKLKLYVDDKSIITQKIPKKNSYSSDLFLGGFPSSLSTLSRLPVFEPFRGCVRNVIVNDVKYEIPSLSRHDHIVGVGQCFATVQPGSYFPGDAYAVYDDKFKVGSILELRIEFRTWELNGVILSVTDSKSQVSLSLELNNGAVVLSVNVSHKRPLTARVSLHNRYEFCDNRWHTVTAHYIQDSITLRVDNYPESYGFNGSHDLKKVLVEAPLYIGGLPANASQGTLVGRENFKGCIRNIVLNSEIKDWTDMYRLHHVFLNACPVL